MDNEKLKASIHKMSPEEYAHFTKQVHMSYPQRTPALTNNIVNFWKRCKEISHGCNSDDRSGTGSNPLSSQSIVDKAPQPWQQSAWKSGFIFRGDKIPSNGYLFMDVEKVGMRILPGEKTHKQKAATVCVVNEDGKIVLWAFIRRPDEMVCQYAPKITNLTKGKLDIGIEEEMVHFFLKKCLEGNTLVGLAIHGDLASLNYYHTSTFDLQEKFRDEAGGFSLGLIAQEILSGRSGFQKGHHSAIDDARMTLSAYKKLNEILKNGNLEKTNNKLSMKRDAYKKNKSRVWAEKCTC